MKFSAKLTALAVATAFAGAANAQFAASTTDINLTVYAPNGQPTLGGGWFDYVTNVPVNSATPYAVNSAFNLSTAGGAVTTAWNAFVAANGGAAAESSFTFSVGGANSGQTLGELGYQTAPNSGFFANISSIFASGGGYVGDLTSTSGSAAAFYGTFSTTPAVTYATYNGGTNDFGGNSVGVTIVGTGTTTNLYVTNGSTTNTAEGTFTFDATTGAGSFAPLAAVPEPGSFALMGAGLLAVGAMVRRRTRG